MTHHARLPATTLATPLRRSLGRFMAWWGHELAGAIPHQIKQWWRGANRASLLTLDGDTALLEEYVEGRVLRLMSVELRGNDADRQLQFGRELNRINNPGPRPYLRLPAQLVLRREIVLPLAVEENLRQTLSFELDRFTPFRPEQACFDYRLIERDVSKRELTVELVVIERSVIDKLIAHALALGVSVAGAALVVSDASSNGFFNFLPEQAIASNVRPAARRRAVSLALTAVLLATLLAVPIWQKRAAAISLLAPLAEAKAAAEATDVLRNRLDRLVSEHNFPLDMKWGSASIILILEELSKQLPDDTFIMQLDFDGKSIQIQGESASAAQLVELLENSPMFKDVAFKAQLTKIQGTSNDRFHISAQIEDAAPKPAGQLGARQTVADGANDSFARELSTTQSTRADRP